MAGSPAELNSGVDVVVFSIYEPGIAERALRAANEIDRLLFYPERNESADTAKAIVMSLGEYLPWHSSATDASAAPNSSDADAGTGPVTIDPSTESVLADIFVTLHESPVGLFQRMPSLLGEFRRLARDNWKNADRQQLLRLRDFFLGISSEVSSVRRASVVW